MRLRAGAWTALLLPPVAWFGFEQGLSHLLHTRCGMVGAGVVWGVASLVVCGVAAATAWSLTCRDRASGSAPVWLARVALAMSGIFALAITFQTLAILMVPPCVG